MNQRTPNKRPPLHDPYCHFNSDIDELEKDVLSAKMTLTALKMANLNVNWYRQPRPYQR